MHGSLLGWWWNKSIMPWDSDIDVQMSEKSIHFLAAYYNMTTYHFKLPGIADGRDYLLEINPNYLNSSASDKHNVIDARWVDMETGLFIDVTTLRRNTTAEPWGFTGAMMCKDKHNYLYDDIFPLRESFFENVPVRIPFAYSELLQQEYGVHALTKMRYAHHVFDEEKLKWVHLKYAISLLQVV